MSHMDAVCGMQVDERRAAHTRVSFAGRTFYFCSAGCKDAFEDDPFRFGFSRLDVSAVSPADPGTPQR